MKLRVAGHGPLVIKVSGLAGGSGLYHEETAAAAAAGFRVAALDTSGDRADDPAPGALDWDTLAGDVTEALDRLGARRAVLWGTSFGSLVCLATAARSPERVAGLLLCTPPEPGWRPAPHLAVLRWTAARRDPVRSTARWFHACFLLLNSWEFLGPKALVRLPALAQAAGDARTPATTIQQKLGLLFGDHPGMPGRDVPCTIIAGGWDMVAPASGARRLAAALSGARLRLLRGAGHAGAYARPRTYARWSIEELRRLWTAAGIE